MTSSLFLARDLAYLNELKFFFEMAFQCSKMGLVSLIITKRVDVFEELKRHPYIAFPNILKRINFKFLASKAEILLWSQLSHESRVKPEVVILLDLKSYTGEDATSSVEICHALQEATCFFTSANKHRFSHLMMAFPKENSPDFSLSRLLGIFHNIYTIEDDNRIANKVYPKHEAKTFILYNEDDNMLAKAFPLNIFSST